MRKERTKRRLNETRNNNIFDCLFHKQDKDTLVIAHRGVKSLARVENTREA